VYGVSLNAIFERWISRDPIEENGGLNLYGYVENNVTRLTDPLGMTFPLAWPICQVGFGMWGSGGGVVAAAAVGAAVGTAAGMAMSADCRRALENRPGMGTSK
jgi:uncharacterized protein RhaS with RHS repeats